MGARARAVAFAVLGTLGCHRRTAAPTPPSVDAPAPSMPVAVALDAGSAPADAGPLVGARGDAGDASVTRGAWQRLPIARWAPQATLGRWQDAPDLDGDGVADEVFAVDVRAVRCEQASRDAPCPDEVPTVAVADALDGATTLALATRYSGDVAAGADGGRIFGLSRVWTSRGAPTSRLEAIDFAEYGAALAVRVTLAVDHGAGLLDTVDRVDLFTGAEFASLEGSVVHHCVRPHDAPPHREGSVAVATAMEAPAVWRYASAHPFSGCAMDAQSFDASLGLVLARDLVLRELRASTVASMRAVHLAITGGRAVVVEDGDDASAQPDARCQGDTCLVAAAHRGDADVLRYAQGGASCTVRVARPRTTGRVQRVAGSSGPVADDPHPVAVVPDGSQPGALAAVFSRRGVLLRVTLPATCGASHHAVTPAPYDGPLPAGTAASPDGATVLFVDGHDLWLARRGDAMPALVNVPGTGLPRGTVRAVGFVDARQVAVVLGRSLYEFTLDAPDPLETVPSSLVVDGRELDRAAITAR